MRGDLQEGHFTLPEANFLSPWCQSPSSRAQNRGFCALLPFKTPIFGAFEHKIGVFVSERATFPRFCPLSSTKSAFLCALTFKTPIFGAFEYKKGFFVSERATFPRFCPLSSTKSAFLCAFALRDRHFRASRAQNRGIGVFVLGKSHRSERVGRKGRVIAERAKGSRNLRDAYGAQYSKKIIFLLFIPFI